MASQSMAYTETRQEGTGVSETDCKLRMKKYNYPIMPRLSGWLLITSFLLVPIIPVAASPLSDDQWQRGQASEVKDDSQTASTTQPVSSQSTSDTSQNNTATDKTATNTNTGNANPGKSISTTPQSFIPMTAGEKFNYFTKSSFFSLGPYGYSVLSGVFGEATDKD